MKSLAIIPARGGSKGLLRKNMKLLNGHPLIYYTIIAALNSKKLSDVLVSSEDAEILEFSEDYTKIQKRPEEHATDTAGVDKLLVHVINKYEEEHGQVDIVVLLYPTSPLRTSDVIDGCLEKFIVNGYDALLTLHEDDKYLWELDEDIARPINYDPANRAPRQLEGWNQYAENKSVYVMKRDLLLRTGCRIGGKVGYHLIDPMQAVDVDDERDLKLAELIMKHKLHLK